MAQPTDDTAASLVLETYTIHGDERGSLISLESGKSVPFDIARVYYIFGTQQSLDRGFHAHKCLHQVAVAVCGSCIIHFDDGRQQSSIRLDSPDRGVPIPPGYWHVMSDFSADCVLMVLADQHYDEEDYIRDYDAFLKWKQLP